MAHFMNKQRGAHMGHEEAPVAGVHKGGEHHSGGAHHPHFAIHSHEGGHEMHITHHDGRVEHHHHEPGDADGLASHIHEHIGGEPGQDHGYSSGDAEEDEYGLGGPQV